MLDWVGFEEAVILAAANSLERGGRLVARRAKAKAPVRKILASAERRFKVKSAAQFEADRAILGPDVPVQRLTLRSTDRTYRLIKIRKLAFSGVLEDEAAEELLDRRGRYELRSGRADHREQVGGRLKGEIHSTEAEFSGRQIHVSVISPTPYARYQEIGTRHNAAHPYMRPALEESREAIIADLKASVRSAAVAANPAGKGGTVKIVLKAKVT